MELSSLARLESARLAFYPRAGKSVILVNPRAVPCRAVIVTRSNQFTITYRGQALGADLDTDHWVEVEVVTDPKGVVWFREGRDLFTTQQLAARLVTLVQTSV